MVHPMRTLLYELLIEPFLHWWRWVQALGTHRAEPQPRSARR